MPLHRSGRGCHAFIQAADDVGDVAVADVELQVAGDRRCYRQPVGAVVMGIEDKCSRRCAEADE
jgi:hypothetical protein